MASTFTRDLGLGLRTWIRSWLFIFSNGLAIYFLYPIVLSILLGMGAVALIRRGVNYAMDLIRPLIDYTPMNSDSGWEAFRDVLMDISSFAVSFVLWIAAFYTFVKLSKYVLLALMSPVMAILSERTEEILTGKTYPFHLQLFIKDVFRGIAIALRNLFMELFTGWALISLQLALTLLFPPFAIILAPLVPLLSFAIGAYFFGFSTLDYVFERRRLSMRQSILTIRSMKGLAVGNGAVFNLIYLIPFIGVTISTITCTVAAVIAIHERENATSEVNA
jgi:CysZ protein